MRIFTMMLVVFVMYTMSIAESKDICKSSRYLYCIIADDWQQAMDDNEQQKVIRLSDIMFSLLDIELLYCHPETDEALTIERLQQTLKETASTLSKEKSCGD